MLPLRHLFLAKERFCPHLGATAASTASQCRLQAGRAEDPPTLWWSRPSVADLTHLHPRLCGSLFDLASRTLRDLPRPWQSKALIFPTSTLDSWHTSFASHKCVCSGHSAAKTYRASAALCSPKASQTMASSSVVVGELRCRLAAARDDPSADLL